MREQTQWDEEIAYTMRWAEAESFCIENGKRLPKIAELISLREQNPELFQNTDVGIAYWSAESQGSRAESVEMKDGRPQLLPKSAQNSVRCVTTVLIAIDSVVTRPPVMGEKIGQVHIVANGLVEVIGPKIQQQLVGKSLIVATKLGSVTGIVEKKFHTKITLRVAASNLSKIKKSDGVHLKPE